VYENALLELQSLVAKSQAALRKQHIYPLPPSLAIPTPRASWLSALDLSGNMATHLKTAQYRRITSLLNELATLREIARRGEQAEVMATIGETLRAYERPEAAGSAAAGSRPDGKIDNYGRSVSVGKRKESSARVWMIRTKPVEVGQKTDESTTSLEAWRKIEGENVVPQTEVLINSRPIHKHFPRPADRELIMRPLRLTGLIGHYNIFALTSGGGTTGQAGAVALGVARGLATHRPELREILQKG
jgi:small subunit ribosomal protein S9